MEEQPCVFLGIKVKPGPIERHKLENFGLDNTVDILKTEAEKKTNLPSSSLELIHHGKVLKDEVTLKDCGVKSGEMVHVVKKKVHVPPTPPPAFTDAELQQLNASLRTLGCTPNAPGWTRAMQLLNDESAMAEILEHAPSLNEDCVTLSILHEVELLAALGANIQTMRRGADAHPELPHALRQLMRLVRSRSSTSDASLSRLAPMSGFAYSLEALSDDEEADEEDNEDGERGRITQELLAVALQAATESTSTASREGQDLIRLLRAAGEGRTPSTDPATPANSESRSFITQEMFNEAITQAINRTSRSDSTPMEQSTTASSSQSPSTGGDENFATQLQHMHEMGLLDDALNIRALLISSGDVNAAIDLVFSGAIGDD